ncbi:GlxA family transcriptional regulator [Pokkaliibacter sp. CJK22405]|uniref:GlxA family transcriptional regulator n=1 Tax=Pokkaliibacter sp. CJK22405 TaxID=3384615 RepID=UPI00398517D3
MFGERPDTLPQRLSFLLLPGFSLFGLTAMLNPLRHANRYAERELYQFELLSESGGLVASSDGLEVTTATSLRQARTCETLIIVAGAHPQRQITPTVLAFIRKQASLGADIGSQDTAAFITASAGVLNGYRSTVHWEHLESTRQQFPEVSWVQEVVVVDRSRFSCAGGLAGLDLMLHLIASQHGQTLAANVADELIYTQLRAQHEPQRPTLNKRLDSRNPALQEAVLLMERNLEEPLKVAEIARQVGISTRELERLFRHYQHTSPARYYRDLRLDQARWMLQQTAHSITTIADACGFPSLSHFSRCYQQRFLKSPSKER